LWAICYCIVGLTMGSKFAFKKLSAVRNVRGHRTLAVDGAPTPLGLSHSEMTLTTEAGAVTTSGEYSRKTSAHYVSIEFALKRRKEALNVREFAAHAPVGVELLLGQVISGMTPTTEVVVVATLGGLSLVFHYLFNHCVHQYAEFASRRRRVALNVRAIAKPAVVGLQQRILLGHCHFEMIPIIVQEAVLISGFLIAAHQYIPLSTVRRTTRVK